MKVLRSLLRLALLEHLLRVALGGELATTHALDDCARREFRQSDSELTARASPTVTAHGATTARAQGPWRPRRFLTFTVPHSPGRGHSSRRRRALSRLPNRLPYIGQRRENSRVAIRFLQRSKRCTEYAQKSSTGLWLACCISPHKVHSRSHMAL